MNIDNFTKILMTILTFALLLNGFNPWINPTPALAVEKSKNKTIKFDGNCFSNNKVASHTLEGVNDTKRVQVPLNTGKLWAGRETKRAL